MGGKSKAPFFVLGFLVIAGISLLNITNVYHLSNQERATRILWLRGKTCRQPIQVDIPMEANLTVECANNAYWLGSQLHCNYDNYPLSRFGAFSAYCWKVTELDPETLKPHSPASKR